MTKIRLHYLLGDVHLGGHDVHRVYRAARRLLEATGAFDLLTVCDDARYGAIRFEEYLTGTRMEEAEAFVFHCGNWRFHTLDEQRRLESAVSAGAGFLLMHGEQPCYWPAAGMTAWEAFERMAGLVWREQTTHGDYGDFQISITDPSHPVMAGIPAFRTRDEIFCTMENPHQVDMQVLATAYSDPTVISRHGEAGTGKNEPVAAIGRYGRGRTFNLSLGHVWPYYTGHGLEENTMAAWSAIPMRSMFVRACEWVARGCVEETRNFSGNVILHDV